MPPFGQVHFGSQPPRSWKTSDAVHLARSIRGPSSGPGLSPPSPETARIGQALRTQWSLLAQYANIPKSSPKHLCYIQSLGGLDLMNLVSKHARMCTRLGLNTRITTAISASDTASTTNRFHSISTFLSSSPLLPHQCFCLLGFGGNVYVYRVSCVP